MFFIDFDVLLSYVDIAEERIDADRTMTTPPPFISSVYILVKVASSSGPSSNLFCTRLPVKVYKYTPPRMSDKKWQRTQQQQQPNKCATHLSTMQQHLNWPFVLGPDLPAAPSPQ
jgi:hypothetical protein